MRNKLAPRRARDLRAPEFKGVKRGPTVPKEKEERWPRDVCRIMGGKRAIYPSIRAPIKGYRALERKLNPPPKTKTVGLRIAGCIRFVTAV